MIAVLPSTYTTTASYVCTRRPHAPASSTRHRPSHVTNAAPWNTSLGMCGHHAFLGLSGWVRSCSSRCVTRSMRHASISEPLLHGASSSSAW